MLLLLLVRFGIASDPHMRVSVLMKGALQVLKVLYLAIPGSFALPADVSASEGAPWALWQCSSSCPSTCLERPGGSCVANSNGTQTTCTCEFRGVESELFKWLLTVVVFLSSWVMLAIASADYVKMRRRGDLRALGVNELRITVPLIVLQTTSVSAGLLEHPRFGHTSFARMGWLF